VPCRFICRRFPAAVSWPHLGRRRRRIVAAAEFSPKKTVDVRTDSLSVRCAYQHQTRRRGCAALKPAENLSQTVRDVLALKERPTRAIVTGDCAFLHGEEGNYRLLGKLIEPLRKADMEFHFALGNHDNRDRFLSAFPTPKSSPPPNQNRSKNMFPCWKRRRPIGFLGFAAQDR